MSSIRANITNTYQATDPNASRKPDAASRRNSKDRQEDKPSMSIVRQIVHENEAERLKHRADITNQSKLKKEGAELDVPIEPSDLPVVPVHFINRDALVTEHKESPPHQKTTQEKTIEAKSMFRDTSLIKNELKSENREHVINDNVETRDRRRKGMIEDTTPREAPMEPPRSSSVLEQFMQRVREQARAQKAESESIDRAKAEEVEKTEAHSIEESEKVEDDIKTQALATTEEMERRDTVRDQTEVDLYSIHRKIHEDFLNNLKERASASEASVESQYLQKHKLESANQLPAEQAPVAQRPVFEALEQPEPLDQEQLVNKLTLALIPERPEEPTEPDLKEGTKVLDHLQREGVFGLSPQGRYQSVNDFIRTKGFEYELEQRPFTEDEFLRETEAAIYDILNRGNSSSVAKSLIQAAEAVNSFRNIIVRSTDETVEPAPLPRQESTAEKTAMQAATRSEK